MQKTNVLIVGGGVGGLTLGIKLAACGIDVVTIERHEKPDSLYKGELLQPKTLQILDEIGVLDQICDNGHVLPAIEITELKGANDGVYHKAGESVMDYTVLPVKYNFSLMIPHEKLKDILREKACSYKSFHYLSPAACKEYKENEAIIHLPDTKEQIEIEADFFVGAEGRKSVTRTAMGLEVKQETYNHHFLTVTFRRPETMVTGKIISTQDEFLGLFPLPQNEVRTVLLIPAGSFKDMKTLGIEAVHHAYVKLCPELDGYVQQLADWKRIQLMIPVAFHASNYVKGRFAIIGDAAHAVHPMAGEGMNLAMQDADILGELLCDMYKHNRLQQNNLQWYPKVRKSRTDKILELSHMSALAYSYPYKPVSWFRTKTLKRMERDGLLHYKQMLNISGLGIWDENLYDRMIQIGGAPIRKRDLDSDEKRSYFFNRDDDYPWKADIPRRLL
ncbi:FAD-dependent oxidoreductase [Peribacillus sp. SCS-155]|uniref:FAD-dependent oxidoreductase n=1 Tax=Peribacillus sedimenti TaxID=3115297 RepID=UPI003905FBA2